MKILRLANHNRPGSKVESASLGNQPLDSTTASNFERQGSFLGDPKNSGFLLKKKYLPSKRDSSETAGPRTKVLRTPKPCVYVKGPQLMCCSRDSLFLGAAHIEARSQQKGSKPCAGLKNEKGSPFFSLAFPLFPFHHRFQADGLSA